MVGELGFIIVCLTEATQEFNNGVRPLKTKRKSSGLEDWSSRPRRNRLMSLTLRSPTLLKMLQILFPTLKALVSWWKFLMKSAMWFYFRGRYNAWTLIWQGAGLWHRRVWSHGPSCFTTPYFIVKYRHLWLQSPWEMEHSAVPPGVQCEETLSWHLELHSNVPLGHKGG